MVYNNILELIGKTPLVRLDNYRAATKLGAKIMAKLEYFNPTGSVKDRVASAIIEDAEKIGKINPDTVIIEPTSGNMGISLAAVCALKKYRLILTMPETVGAEFKKLISVYGAEIVLTDRNKGISGAIIKADELSGKIPNSFVPDQFNNFANPQAHFDRTGWEIWKDTRGRLDYFVAAVGTGGTISGAGAYLKKKNPKIQVIAVEPSGSPVLSRGKAGAHNIPEIGFGFVPNTLNIEIYDQVIKVKEDDAVAALKKLAETEGIFAGISSGAALWAASQTAKNPENAGKNIVVILPDTGKRYI